MSEKIAWYELYKVIMLLKESKVHDLDPAVLLLLMDKILLTSNLKEVSSESS